MKQNNEIDLKIPNKEGSDLGIKLDGKSLTWKEWLCYLSWMLSCFVIPKENKNFMNFYSRGFSIWENGLSGKKGHFGGESPSSDLFFQKKLLSLK